MDRDHFDRLTRAFACGTTRRRLGCLFLALSSGAGAGAIFSSGDDAEAKRRKKRKRKRRKKHQANPDPACQPNCTGKSCGDDGCGGSCGGCTPPLLCDENTGQCVEKTCGLCPAGLVCCGAQCVDPYCHDKVCGLNDCGTSCGSCPIDKPFCVADGYVCAAVPDVP